MWADIRHDMRISLENAEPNVKHYLVAEKNTSEILGYLDLTYNDCQRPEVDIAIAGEFRRKGYGYEAARTLIDHVFREEDIQAIIWTVFPTNLPSRRIAEKLGGILIEEKNVIKEIMEASGFSLEVLKDRENMPLALSYEIRKRDWNPFAIE